MTRHDAVTLPRLFAVSMASLLTAGVLVAQTGLAQAPADAGHAVAAPSPQRVSPPSVPSHNAADLAEAPPRPPASEADDRARAFFAAVAADDPEAALHFFLPRAAFRQIKGVADPDRFFDRLVRHFRADVHGLHQAHPELAHAVYVRVDLSRRRGWIAPRQEANRLPYWSVRHSRLIYTVNGAERSFELRTLITWDDHWYLTHLLGRISLKSRGLKSPSWGWPH